MINWLGIYLETIKNLHDKLRRRLIWSKYEKLDQYT